jgi:hypothetical protein
MGVVAFGYPISRKFGLVTKSVFHKPSLFHSSATSLLELLSLRVG